MTSSVNPSPFTDPDNAGSNNNETKEITFTLSDDEIGEDSNASNYNMQHVLSVCQTAGVFDSSGEGVGADKQVAAAAAADTTIDCECSESSGFQSVARGK